MRKSSQNEQVSTAGSGCLQVDKNGSVAESEEKTAALLFSRITPARMDEHVPIHYVRIIVLGDRGVGKTSIVQRLVNNSYTGEHIPTLIKEEHYPSLVFESSILECKVVDLPPISNFPASSEEEWLQYRGFGLRSAHAYILVYDVTSPKSFMFLQFLREQIAISRGLSEVPMVVAANKCDLGHSEATNKAVREEMTAKVRKSWKLVHQECSASHNWNIGTVFRELAREVLRVRKEGPAGLSQRGGEQSQACCLVCI